MEFFTVTLGNIIQLAVFLAGGIAFAYTIRGDVKVTSVRLSAVERELSELRKVVVDIARQEERLNAIDQRIIMSGQRLDDTIRKLDKLADK